MERGSGSYCITGDNCMVEHIDPYKDQKIRLRKRFVVLTTKCGIQDAHCGYNSNEYVDGYSRSDV